MTRRRFELTDEEWDVIEPLYDKRADNFLAAIKLFCTRLWIATNESTA